MQAFLETLLPRLYPDLDFLCVPHQGKNDLESSLRRKLPAWNVPGDVFVIVRDNDGGDCQALKAKLHQICLDAGKEALIRVVCQELEAWYLGDFEALASEFGDESLAGLSEKRKYRDPDHLGSPSRELRQIVPSFQKLSGARKMGQALQRGGNRSHSYNVFLSGVEHLIQESA